MTLKKIFAPLAAVALVAVMAISLVSQTHTASAVVNGLSAAPAAVNAAGVVTLTIDADDGLGNVRVLATSGDFTACLDGLGVACAFVVVAPPVVLEAGADADIDFTVDDAVAGGNTNTLTVTWVAPATGPQTVTFTVIQGTSTKTTNVVVRGAADKVEFRILTAASTSATTCAGVDAEVIRSTTATAGLGLAGVNLCAVVLDSAGNRLPAQAVVYSTTAGSFAGAGISDVTTATGGPATLSTLVPGATGLSGVTATVTASAGGKTATDTVKFGGDPASCAATTNPTSVAPGGASTVTIDVKDTTGGPVPDGNVIAVAQANAGQGANAAVLNPAPTTAGGKATSTVIAAIPGTVAIGATSVTVNPGATCTGTLLVTGAPPVPPTGTPPTGTAGFSGATIAAQGVTIVSFTGTTAQLDSIGAANTPKIVTVTATVNGKMIVFVIGAPAFVNAEFNAAFPTGLNATLVIVKTGT